MHYYAQCFFSFVCPFLGFRLLNLFNLILNENKIGYFDVRERLLKILIS